MIEISQLCKKYGTNEVLKGINLTFDTPGITAILGPNGSGKTTLLKCLLGMVFPDKGIVSFKGKSIGGQYAYRKQISHLPQIAQFPENLTPLDLVKMLQDLRVGGGRSEELIDLFGLSGEMNKGLSRLSGGTRQKVNIMLALMYDSEVLVLDEPTTGLDPLAIKRLKNFINSEKERGKYILFTTHIMSLVEDLAEHIVFLLDGEIYFKGSVGSLLQQQNESSLETAIAGILQTERS